MDTNDRQRKDRLIQTRVPQNLENTLKDEARKRRLSVSHLIRNVLEDTFNLVDNVVTEVDRVVADSMGMAQTLKRDAQRLAATARGQTAHRNAAAEPDAGGADPDGAAEPPGPTADEPDAGSVPDKPHPEHPETPQAELVPAADRALQPAEMEALPAERDALSVGPLADVFGFQELVLNRNALCAACGSAIARGTHAFLGMTDAPRPRVWVCQTCISALSP